MSMTRTDIEGLLPFLANETLAGDERAAVEAAVAADPGLQTELEALRLMRHAMQAETLEASPGELGLARLMRDVDAAPQTTQSAPAGAPEPAANDNVVPLRRLRFWQAAAAAVAVLGLAQAYVTTQPFGEAGDAGEVAVLDQGDAGQMRLAGGGDGDLPPAVFRVGFIGETTEARIREALIAADLQIVSGPSALGLYELAPGRPSTDLDAASEILMSIGLEVIELVSEAAE